MACTVNCPRCGETIPVHLEVDKDFVPSNPSLGRSGSSDYHNFSDLDDTPSSPVLAHSVNSDYQGMGHGGNKKTRKRSNSDKKKKNITKRKK